MISNVKATKGIGDNVLKKTIHKGSESIMFSVLQETQYMYPFKSSVREIVSNSLDSINEKNNALKILKQEIKIEDLFIEKEGEEFNDSRFDAEYYDEKWLSNNSIVKIRYIENDSTTRDRIQFIDEGVGLGGNRLVNYFSLGFSTKRLSKSQLGNFGLGAKSLLATGVDFYTVTSRYNGKLFRFNVFKDHVISIIPKFNEDTGKKNFIETFYNDFKCHYEKTTEKNAVIVEAEVKRHRKQDYLNAVENQLGFIEDVELLISDPVYGIRDSKRNIKSEVLYRTNKIMVGDSDYYAKPQILLRPGEDSGIFINYGPINFDELEMKRYSGNVSFIMNINDVDVTPSRESVIWNAKTRDAIKNMFIEAQNTIKSVIQEKIKDAKSLSQHLNMLETFKSKNTTSGMSELYKVIDTSQLELTFKTFNLSKAAIELKDEKLFSLTSTGTVNNWSNSSVKDTDYTSKLSKKYLSFLSPLHNNFKSTIVYIGDTRYKDLARYVHKKISGANSSYDNNTNIIFIKKSHYDTIRTVISTPGIDLKNKKFEDLPELLDNAYEKELQANIVFGEVFLAVKNGMHVLFEEDIDKTEMKKISEVAVETSNNRYMTTSERAKLENKISCNKFNGGYTYKTYCNEDDLEASILNGTPVILYRNNNEIESKFISPGYRNTTTIIEDHFIIGLSEDGFKRFSKVKGVKLLTDIVFNIEFGEISLTPLGKELVSATIRDIFKNGDIEKLKQSSMFSYVKNNFTAIKLDTKHLNEKILSKIVNVRRKRKRALQNAS